MKQKEQLSLSEAARGYYIAKEADGLSEYTILGYRWCLDRLTAYLGDVLVRDITHEDLQQFIGYLRTDYRPTRMNGNTDPLSHVSLQKAWAGLRSFFGWASVELGIPRPDMAIKRPQGIGKAVIPFTHEEIVRLVHAAEYTAEAHTERRTPWSYRRPTALRDLALVYLLLDTGLRVSEVARLKIGDVDLDTGEVEVVPFGSGRKSRGRHVHLGKTARKAVWRYLSAREDSTDGDYLFLTIEGRPMNRNSIRLLVDHMGNRAGVRGVHPHRFRHTMSIMFLRNGGDIFTLQQILGHNSLEMVRHYLLIAQSDVDEAHRMASPVDRGRF